MLLVPTMNIGEIGLLAGGAWAGFRFLAFALSRALEGIKRLSGLALEVRTYRERRRAELYEAQFATQRLKRALTEKPHAPHGATLEQKTAPGIQKHSASKPSP